MFGIGVLFGNSAFAKSSNTVEYKRFSKTHMLILKCANSETTHIKSRLAVLDTPHSKDTDYAIVTGHGLPLQMPCYVQDFYGNRKDVDVIDYAKDYSIGTNKDWAVIRFEKIETERLIRYPLSPITHHIKDFSAVNISFAQARGLPVNTQNCQLISQRGPKQINNSSNYSLFHNCHVIPGQSGSPITFTVDERDYLVGLHIGRIRFLRSPYTGRPQILGHIALFDDAMVHDIRSIIQRSEIRH